MRSDLKKELSNLLNHYSAESGSNTPDFILAEYLFGALEAFYHAVTMRESWHGRRSKEPTAPPYSVSLAQTDGSKGK